MAWWTWALILWAMVASATVLWLAARLSAKVELLAKESTDRDELWSHGLPADDASVSTAAAGRSMEALASGVAHVRRYLAPGVRW
jgi:hypothetical protein